MKGIRTIVYNIEGQLTLKHLREIVDDTKQLPEGARVNLQKMGSQLDGTTYRYSVEY